MTSAWIAVPFDPAAATPAQRLAVGHLLADAFAFAYPDLPPLLPDKEAQGLTQHDLTDEVTQFVVWDGTKALGWASLTADTAENLYLAFASVIVDPQARQRGLGRLLAHELEAVARRGGRTIVIFSTTSHVPAGEAFARSLGAGAALTNRQSRLELSQLAPELLRDWQQRPASDPYRLHVWATIPDEYLARVASLMEVMNTAPRGDLEMDDWRVTPEMVRHWEVQAQEQGEQVLTLAAEHLPSGELHGYTQTFWDAQRAALVYQGTTAVRPAARGLGLGKWLKAAMLEQVLTRCPGAKWVQTNNAEENAAMLGINVALGFVPWATVTQWQVKLA